MAGALGDLLQVIDNQSYLEQQVLNVYYYRITSITGVDETYLDVLNDWFTENIVEKVTPLQLDTLLHVSREWRNLSNGVDLFTDTTVIEGEDPGTSGGPLPSYVSLGFLLRRESLTTRNGYKRFSGLDEALIGGNEYVGSMTPINDLEVALASDVVLGLVTVAEPIIVRRPLEPPVEEYVYSSIGSAQFRGVGTQNSRKRGRGV